VLASGLVVACVAVALSVTVWGYRDAIDAHALAAHSAREVSGVNIAEAYLVRERKAMNEFFLNPDEVIQLQGLRAGFRRGISQVGGGEADEIALGRRAIAANDEFLRTFTTAARTAKRDPSGFVRLDAKLDAAEQRVLAPLGTLRAINNRLERERLQRADASSHRAFLAAILAGSLAIGGGLAFALYATRLVTRLGSQNRQLRELDRMKDDFVSSVSHELRTPLTSIRGYLELVLEREAGDLTEEQERFLGIVARNADRLLRVVGDLLFVAQVDAGTIALEPGACDLEEVASEAVEAVRPAAVEKGIELALAADDVPELTADRARIAQVLDNLVSNAVKFTPVGGRVTVRAFSEGNEALVEVTDTGMGIAPQDQEHLFQRFFRTAAASEEAIPGTGLGLAIVKAIVEAHGGSISVASEVGHGTTFQMRLPLEREQVRV
jgi:signal transduction histidine kinase